MDALAPRIRRAARADERSLADLSETCFVDTFVHGFGVRYAADDLAAFLDQGHSRAAFLRMLADPAQKLWIAADPAGEALGYAAAGPCRLPHPEVGAGDAELKRLYLRAPAQGTGLAARLMETALRGIDPAGTRRLWLGVWSGNLRAQHFYARYGFEIVGEYDFPVGAAIDREFIMRRG